MVVRARRLRGGVVGKGCILVPIWYSHQPASFASLAYWLQL